MEHHGQGLKGTQSVVFGGTGPVGVATGVIAASCGANTTVVDHASLDNALEKAQLYGKLFDVQLDGTCAASEADRAHLLHQADVVFCTAKAGVQALKAGTLAEAKRLKVAADVNAVPPLGIEGVKRTDHAAPLKHAVNLLGSVRRILAETRCEPEWLKLEVNRKPAAGRQRGHPRHAEQFPRHGAGHFHMGSSRHCWTGPTVSSWWNRLRRGTAKRGRFPQGSSRRGGRLSARAQLAQSIHAGRSGRRLIRHGQGGAPQPHAPDRL